MCENDVEHGNNLCGLNDVASSEIVAGDQGLLRSYKSGELCGNRKVA
jgi:hypothetical protein